MRILVVDDDPELTRMLQLVFESKGFGVTIANDGEEALDRLKEELPEAILLDLMMPGIDGSKVCQQIRANPRTSNIPVIVLTAKSDTKSKRELLKAGATEYLIKPIRHSTLIEHVRQAVTQPVGSFAKVLT